MQREYRRREEKGKKEKSGTNLKEKVQSLIRELCGVQPHVVAERLGVSFPEVSRVVSELKEERLVGVARNLPYMNSLKKANATYYLDVGRPTALHDTLMNVVWQRNEELGGTCRDYSFEWGGKSWHSGGVLENGGRKFLLEVVAGGYHDGIMRQVEAYLAQMRQDRYLRGVIVAVVENKRLIELREKALLAYRCFGIKLFIMALRPAHEKLKFESLLRHGDANAYHENPTH